MKARAFLLILTLSYLSESIPSPANVNNDTSDNVGDSASAGDNLSDTVSDNVRTGDNAARTAGEIPRTKKDISSFLRDLLG